MTKANIERTDVCIPKAPYIMIYDASSNTIVAYHSFKEEMNLTVLKAAFVSAVEEHVDEYGRNLMHLARVADELKGKMQQKESAFPMQMAMGLAQKSQNRLEDALHRIAEWQGGWGVECSVVLPFCLTALEKVGDSGQEIINFRESRPFNNGFIFTVVYREEPGAGAKPIEIETKVEKVELPESSKEADALPEPARVL